MSILKHWWTYNNLESIAGSRIFPTDIPTTTNQLNTITSTYNLVKNSRDVSSRLGFSKEVSLKIMSGLIGAGWAGQFIKETNDEEKMVSLMAVMKYTKVWLYMLVYQLIRLTYIPPDYEQSLFFL